MSTPEEVVSSQPSSQVVPLASKRHENSRCYKEYFRLADHGIVFYELENLAAGAAILDANPAACRLLGYSRAEIVRLTPLDLLASECRRAAAGEIERLEEGRIRRHEETLVTRDGRQVPAVFITHRFQDRGCPVAMSIILDNSKHQRTEAALRASEERFHKMAQASFEGICFCSGGTIADCNEQLAEMYGYRREEMIGMRVVDLIAPEWRETVLAEIQQEPGRAIEHEIIRKDGLRLTVEARCWKLPSEDDPVRITTIRDVTERKRAEAAVRESEERLRWALEAAGGEAWDWDIPGNKGWLSEEMYKLLGVEPGTRMDASGTLSLIYEADREELVRAIQDATAQQANFQLEFRIRHTERGVRWLTVQGRPAYDVSGRPVRLLGVAMDITDRKEAEEALRKSERLHRRLAEANLFGIRFGDSQGGVTYANDEMLRMMGYSREDLEAGRINWAESVAPEYRADNAVLMERLKCEGMLPSTERAFLRPDGGRTPYLMTAALVSPEKDLHVSIAVDLTPVHAAEERLRVLNETLEQRVAERTAEVHEKAQQLRSLAIQLSQTEQRERKRLAKILHDHIQQLIVAARMQLGWMEGGGNLDEVHAMARDVNAILQEALDASRSLTVDLSPPVLHEAGLIGGLNWLVSNLWKKNQFRVRLLADSKAEPADEDTRMLLFECVRELLFNAVKHAGVTEAQVSLARMREGTIRLIVSDRGRGFDPDLLKNRRADEATFGLFSCQERLMHLGGVMEIETAPGEGARITLTMPASEACEANPATEAAAAGKSHEPVRVSPKPEACGVLIVDDHKIMRDGLIKLFGAEPGIEVVGEAADGPTAVRLTRLLNPDVIVMDVDLGEMSGIEATRRILERHPQVPVIGLSMHTDPGVREAMLEAGASTYLTKCGPSEELIGAVRAAFEAVRRKR